MKNLTKGQQQVLNLLYNVISEHKYGQHINKTVNKFNKKYIETIIASEIFSKQEEQGIPIIGKVAAGSPIFSEENIIGYLTPTEKYSGKDIFALQVQGDSMIEAGILDDDYLIVKKTNRISNKEIGVFYYFGEFTVKKIKKDKDKIILLPENHKYQPIEIDNFENFYVIGRVIGIYRKIQDKKD